MRFPMKETFKVRSVLARMGFPVEEMRFPAEEMRFPVPEIHRVRVIIIVIYIYQTEI